MKIQSCEECGVIVDIDRLFFPYHIYLDDGTISDELAVWDGEEYKAYIPCPVCNSPIVSES